MQKYSQSIFNIPYLLFKKFLTEREYNGRDD